jgi:dolichol-phosphate mannosyltransferase
VIQGTADIVVASRWRAGGGVRNWPWYRYVASRLAATLACGLTQMTDPTAGFMAARRALVAGLDLEPVGWKIVLEVVVKAPAARLLEIPIVFFDRERGQSKLGWGAQYDYLRHLLRLYRHRRA